MRRSRTPEQLAIDDLRARRPAHFTASATERRSHGRVPRVLRVRDGFLEWAMEAPGQPVTIGAMRAAGMELVPRSTLGEPLLWSFIRLHAAGDDAFADFARKFGVLHVSERGVPGGDLRTVKYTDETVIDSATIRTASGGYLSRAGQERAVKWRREPLYLWRAWSLAIRLLLLYGLELQRATRRIDPVALINRWELDVPPYDDNQDRWRISEPRTLVSEMHFAATEPDPAGDRETTRDEQREVLGWWLDNLADQCGLALRMSWTGADRPRATIGRSLKTEVSGFFAPDSVFPDIVERLIDVLESAEGVHVCPDCGEPFPCRRRRGYCPDCRSRRKRANARKTWHEHPKYNARRRVTADV